MDLVEHDLTYTPAPPPHGARDFGVRIGISAYGRGVKFMHVSISHATLQHLAWRPGRSYLQMQIGRDELGIPRRALIELLDKAAGGRLLRATRMAGGTGQISFRLPEDMQGPRIIARAISFRLEADKRLLNLDLHGLFTHSHVQERVT